ncbi:hypothetical protein KV205_16370 [Streptomyces sp. SKN60]|nr:hypothetical protein [Streptomyces sp. SKN60]
MNPDAPTPALPRCAILDDFQGAALASADWSPLDGRVEVRALHEHIDPLADPDALVAAVEDCEILVVMREGWISGAGLDVYETEPLPVDAPLRTLPNVLALPHLGYVTRGNYGRYFGQAVEDVEAWLAGKPVRELG